MHPTCKYIYIRVVRVGRRSKVFAQVETCTTGKVEEPNATSQPLAARYKQQKRNERDESVFSALEIGLGRSLNIECIEKGEAERSRVVADFLHFLFYSVLNFQTCEIHSGYK